MQTEAHFRRRSSKEDVHVSYQKGRMPIDPKATLDLTLGLICHIKFSS